MNAFEFIDKDLNTFGGNVSARAAEVLRTDRRLFFMLSSLIKYLKKK